MLRRIRYLLKKLLEKRVLRRVALERLTEPFHLNVASVAVALAGNFRHKVTFDLVVRQQHAFGLLAAADLARTLGISRITAVEFGVAAGAGLINMCEIASQIERDVGITFDIVGFDSGLGLPPPRDWRDHPELYSDGDFPTLNRELLISQLPENAGIRFGDVVETVPAFLAQAHAPIGFISFDLDYYWSTFEALRILQGVAGQYLPKVACYFDDVCSDWHNSFAGALLAINEFNNANNLRKITSYNFLRNERIFKNARWIDCMYLAHVFDHPFRVATLGERSNRVLGNPYFD